MLARGSTARRVFVPHKKAPLAPQKGVALPVEEVEDVEESSPSLNKKRKAIDDDVEDAESVPVTKKKRVELVVAPEIDDIQSTPVEVVNKDWISTSVVLPSVAEHDSIDSLYSTDDEAPPVSPVKIADWACERDTSASLNRNELVTRNLDILRKRYRLLGDRQREFAYMRASNAIKAFPRTIRSGQDVRHLNGVGRKIALKIDDILRTGHSTLVDMQDTDEKIRTMELFTGIWGAGPKACREWYQMGCRTLDDVRRIGNPDDRQVMGLKYYDDFAGKMDRPELEQHLKVVKAAAAEIDPALAVRMAGGYRRGNPTSHDADFVITHPGGENYVKGVADVLVSMLKKDGYIVDDLQMYHGIGRDAPGSATAIDPEIELFDKYFGVCCLGEGYAARRIDIIVVSIEYYAVTMLYFTGGAFFNRQLRQMAKGMGYKVLNDKVIPIDERGLPAGPTVAIRTEKDVFDLFGLKYLEPSQRAD